MMKIKKTFSQRLSGMIEKPIIFMFIMMLILLVKGAFEIAGILVIIMALLLIAVKWVGMIETKLIGRNNKEKEEGGI